MNEKTKAFMEKQRSGIFEALSTFELPVYEDEIAEDEERELLQSEMYNFFTIDFGDIVNVRDNITKLSQMVVIEYYSENKNDVDEVTVDLITLLRKVSAVSFDQSRKERLKMKDTERYIDRVSIVLRRVIPIAC